MKKTKNINKTKMAIYKALDRDKFHLCGSYDGDKETWVLYEKYDGWMTDGSKPIMTSDKYSDKDLLKYLKRRKKISYLDFVKMLIVIPALNVLLGFINIFLCNEGLRYMIWGINLSVWIIIVLELITMSKNDKVSKLDNQARTRRFVKNLER